MKFKKYRKTSPIYVAPSEEVERRGWIKKDGTIDTEEGPQTVNDDDVVCIGFKGEIWPQPLSRIEKKYDLDGHVEDAGVSYKKYTPKPDQSVEAVKMDEVFNVEDMNGKAGDYKVRDVKNKDDEWVVDCEIFEATYTEIS